MIRESTDGEAPVGHVAESCGRYLLTLDLLAIDHLTAGINPCQVLPPHSFLSSVQLATVQKQTRTTTKPIPSGELEKIISY